MPRELDAYRIVYIEIEGCEPIAIPAARLDGKSDCIRVSLMRSASGPVTAQFAMRRTADNVVALLDVQS